MLKGVLRISNPVAMVRGILDLFLAQPFGGRSLMQRRVPLLSIPEVKLTTILESLQALYLRK